MHASSQIEIEYQDTDWYYWKFRNRPLSFQLQRLNQNIIIMEIIFWIEYRNAVGTM